MAVHIFMRIDEKIDSFALWQLISEMGINLTDMDGYSLIYGEIDIQELPTLFSYCNMYTSRPVEATVKWG